MFDTQPEEYNKKMILLTETQWEPIIIESYFTPNIKRKNILFYIKTKARKLAAFVFSTVSELNLTSINVWLLVPCFVLQMTNYTKSVDLRKT